MRIGLIAPPWVPVPPPAYGGTEAVIDLLARGYAAAGHDVVLYTTGDSRCPVERRWTYERSNPGMIGERAVELRHVLDAYEALAGCGVIHDHTMCGPVIGGNVRHAPVVATLHGPIDGHTRRLLSGLPPQVSLVAISHAQAADAQGLPVAAVIHHGLEVEAIPVRGGQGGYVAFLSRMAPEKGAHTAVRVARSAGVRLLIASKTWADSEHRYLDEVVRPAAEGGDVEFLGEVGPDRKYDLLGGARALLAPLTWPEPFGLFMVESLATGTPVLAFPGGAATEIVRHGETGLLCSDEQEMVAALGRVADLDRASCRRSVEERFSAQRMTADYLALFQRLLTAPPRHADL